MSVEHHTHTGGNAGPKLGVDEFLKEGTLNQAVGKLRVDPARVDESYVDNCFVEPTAGWVSFSQMMGLMTGFEAKADRSYANACLITA